MKGSWGLKQIGPRCPRRMGTQQASLWKSIIFGDAKIQHDQNVKWGHREQDLSPVTQSDQDMESHVYVTGRWDLPRLAQCWDLCSQSTPPQAGCGPGSHCRAGPDPLWEGTEYSMLWSSVLASRNLSIVQVSGLLVKRSEEPPQNHESMKPG